MPQATRRDFLKQSSVMVVGAAALSFTNVSRGEGANDKIILGIIGPGGQGTSLYRTFLAQPDVEIAYMCDVDEHRLADAVNDVESQTGKAPQGVKDLRKILEDQAVNAVVIATPDHWHAPATIMACDAGKHVYVEKPASHNLREGRLMVEAARRNKRVVQLGTQSRSAQHVMQAMQLLKDGAIGEVVASKAWNSQRRGTIGNQQPQDPPEWVDYDTWIGPSPMVPYQPNRFHGVWRWNYNFGTGDIGNDGVHDIDLARWGLGVETQPSRIAAMGGKYVYGGDDQDFPDTQYVSFEYDLGDGKKKMLTYEQRIWSPYTQEGYENGSAFYGTEGMLLLGKHHGFQLFGPRNEPRQQVSGGIDLGAHCRDFLDCIKSGGTPRADIEIGHLSSSLSHLGNIATRTGRVINFDPATEKAAGDDEANALVKREYRDHWSVPKGV